MSTTTTKTSSRLAAERLRGRLESYVPAGVLVVWLGLSLAAWYWFDASLRARTTATYEARTEELSSRIVQRMRDHEQVLRGAAGLFAVRETVSRADWRHYVSALRLEENHPGILGVGFSRWLTPAEKEGHSWEVRAEGFPEYKIRPEGERPSYTSILYLEPFHWRNQRAFGFDMYSEAVRRAAMDKARDENVASIAAKIILVQETDKDQQSGMLMFVPVYRQRLPLDTVAQRREAFQGFAYSPIRMNDFVAGTLGKTSEELGFELSVGSGEGTDNLMYSSVAAGKLALPPGYEPELQSSKVVAAYGCSWQFTFNTLPGFRGGKGRSQSYLFLAAGFVFSGLVALLAWLILKSRRQAMELAEQRISRLHGRLSLAAESARLGVWEWQVPENVLVWDKWMYAIYGVREADFTGAYEAWTRGLHPDDRPRGDEAIQRALRGEKEFDEEFRVVWPTGELRHVKANALVERDAAGRPLRMIGVNYDITERKLAEEKLRRSEEQISRLLQATDQGLYGIDREGRCTFINRSGLELLGYELEECLGQDMHVLIHHSHADGSPYPTVECPIFHAKMTGAGCRVDSEVLWRRDGTSFPAEYSSRPILEGGQIAGAVVTFLDITARKNSERDLREARDLAEAASLAKSDFLTTMSHEIRTPMNGVIAMTGLLLETALNPEQREYAEIVSRSGEHLLGLINDILDFSKIEARKLDIEPQEFDPRLMVEDTAEMLWIHAQEAGLELTYQVDASVPTELRGDPGRLRQIIANLVGNAIKFTSSGEVSIRVSLEREQDGWVELRFEIKDTGIGIPAERLGAIFEPFTQADGSTTRKYGGTGLGLAICKQLVELMGGGIGVTSEPGAGSTFWFTSRLERVAPHEARSPSAAASLRADLAGAKLLIVDDNATNRELMEVLLQGFGCRGASACDAQTALSLLLAAVEHHEPFQLVLVAQQLAGMDGYELGRRIKNEPRLSATALVMVSSRAGPGDATLMEESGFHGYVPKPVRQAQLHDCIARALGRDSGAEGAAEWGRPASVVTRHSVAEVARRSAPILLVEDNAINQKVAQEMLKHLGFRADVAADGLEAVRALELIDYSLVLMDCQMPRMDGYEATVAIRSAQSQVRNRNIPIIAMTANAMKGDRERCLAAGMNDYLAKPVRREALLEVLVRWS